LKRSGKTSGVGHHHLLASEGEVDGVEREIRPLGSAISRPEIEKAKV